MNHFSSQIRAITGKVNPKRHLSIKSSKNKKKNSCEETDCCGNPKNPPPKYTHQVERTCHPCSFFTWKPKIPILESPPPLIDGKKKTAKKKCCYAGMKNPKKSLEEIKKEAEECQKQCLLKPICPSPPPPPKPKKKECDLTTPIPVPDWDSNKCDEKK